MTVSKQGKNLVFIISQPRSGSTLLQKILGSHPVITTTVEPWLLLPLVFTMKGRTDVAFDPHNHIDILHFLRSVPDGDRLYAEGISNMMMTIYNAALEDGKSMFLDKTPRYYLIVPELAAIFPEARFIFLFRNPLSVLASMHTTLDGFIGMINSSCKQDLLVAPELLIQGRELVGGRGLSIQYEDLANKPAEEVHRICDWLSVDYDESMLDYQKAGQREWPLGDQDAVYKHGKPVQDSINKWQLYISKPQNWRYARDYLDLLGPGVVEQLGYPCSYAERLLQDNRPGILRRCLTWPLLFAINSHQLLRKLYRRFRYNEALFLD